MKRIKDMNIIRQRQNQRMKTQTRTDRERGVREYRIIRLE